MLKFLFDVGRTVESIFIFDYVYLDMKYFHLFYCISSGRRAHFRIYLFLEPTFALECYVKRRQNNNFSCY